LYNKHLCNWLKKIRIAVDWI